MKTIKFLIMATIFFMLTGLACAGTNVTFQWDTNTEEDLAGYNAYQTDKSGVYKKDGERIAPVAEILLTDPKLNCESGKCLYTLEGVLDGTWYWVFTAFDDKDNESGFSNEVTAMIDSPPGPPQSLTIWQKIIAWLKNLWHRYG